MSYSTEALLRIFLDQDQPPFLFALEAKYREAAVRFTWCAAMSSGSGTWDCQSCVLGYINSSGIRGLGPSPETPRVMNRLALPCPKLSPLSSARLETVTASSFTIQDLLLVSSDYLAWNILYQGGWLRGAGSQDVSGCLASSLTCLVWSRWPKASVSKGILKPELRDT